MPVIVIAEAGVNHNGDPDRALAMVDAAAGSGADFVKFQTFRAADLVTADAPKAAYQTARDGAGSQFEMLRRLELSEAAHHQILARCRARGIGFLSTPFDTASLAFLVGDLGIDRIKIPSGEITNGPLLLAAARTRLPLILSTGMSTLDDVERALAVIAFGLDGQGAPDAAAFAAAFADPAARRHLAGRVTLLHCTTEYPAPIAETNLRAMATLAERFGLPVGFSDHTAGLSAAIAATALGATVIEKHFTLDRALPGPDHRASLEPDELAALVRGVREAEAALGDGIKAPSASERGNLAVARKSLVAARPIAAGEVLSEETLAVKRPGGGISPLEYWAYLGRPAGRAYAEGERIEP